MLIFFSNLFDINSECTDTITRQLSIVQQQANNNTVLHGNKPNNTTHMNVFEWLQVWTKHNNCMCATHNELTKWTYKPLDIWNALEWLLVNQLHTTSYIPTRLFSVTVNKWHNAAVQGQDYLCLAQIVTPADCQSFFVSHQTPGR